MGDKFFNVIGSIVIIGLVTALVYPGRQTPAVIDALGGAFQGSLRVAEGI